MSVSSNGCEEDVLRIKKKLDKMMKTNQIDVQVSIDMLNALKKLPIDLQILKNTGIGVVLNNMRKSCNSEDLGTVAKSLLKNWKKLVACSESGGATTVSSPINSNNHTNDSNSPMSPANHHNSNNNSNLNNSKESLKRTLSNGSSPDVPSGNSNNGKLQKISDDSKSTNENTTNHSNNQSNITATNGNGTQTNGTASLQKANNDKQQQQKKFNPLLRHISFTQTKDPVRLKCREMLANALELSEPIENGSALCDVNEIAARCEDIIYAEFKNTDSKYKNRIRSRVINLKDAKNPKFRESVRLGIITPDQLAVMSSDEMASEELKNLRAKFTQEAIDDHQMARTQGAKTSLLTCGKCKKNNCCFSEVNKIKSFKNLVKY
jgi:transcription elongation factor S-II